MEDQLFTYKSLYMPNYEDPFTVFEKCTLLVQIGDYPIGTYFDYIAMDYASSEIILNGDSTSMYKGKSERYSLHVTIGERSR